MREIRTLRSMRRGLETESRLGLHGHERGNPGYRQDHDLTGYRASSRPYLERARSPDRISEREIQAYLLHLYREKRFSHSTCNVAVAGTPLLLSRDGSTPRARAS